VLLQIFWMNNVSYVSKLEYKFHHVTAFNIIVKFSV